MIDPRSFFCRICDPTLEKNQANIKIEAFKCFLEDDQQPMEVEEVENIKKTKEGNIVSVLYCYYHIWFYK